MVAQQAEDVVREAGTWFLGIDDEFLPMDSLQAELAGFGSQRRTGRQGQYQPLFAQDDACDRGIVAADTAETDVDTARSNKLTYASAGNGTSIHLAGANFTALTGVQMLHVPYRGSGPAVTDLLGGQVDFMFDSITSARPHIQAGKLRALAVTTKQRSASLPDVPTVAEAGVPGYEVSPWFATFMPAGTPAAVVEKLSLALNESMRDPEVKKRLDAIGAEPMGTTPQVLRTHLKQETERWTQLIKTAGISAD